MSLTPTREVERTSIRLPSPSGAHANHDVVGEAEPEGAIARLDPAGLGRLGNDLPALLLGGRERRVERLRRRGRDLERQDVGVGLGLLRGDRRAAIVGRVGGIRAQRQDRLEGRRVGRVGRDVVDRRHRARGVQPGRRQADRDQPDRKPGERAEHAAPPAAEAGEREAERRDDRAGDGAKDRVAQDHEAGAEGPQAEAVAGAGYRQRERREQGERQPERGDRGREAGLSAGRPPRSASSASYSRSVRGPKVSKVGAACSR